MPRYYAGIGSRSTPLPILTTMCGIAELLAYKFGYILRSGGADGADSAFEKGCDLFWGAKEIFLPWKDFNGNKSKLYNPSREAHALAALYHPAWDKCSQGARKLHARNCHQVLGQNLDTPVDFIICWTNGTGGTEQALRIAKDPKYSIKIYNLYDRLEAEELEDMLSSLT